MIQRFAREWKVAIDGRTEGQHALLPRALSSCYTGIPVKITVYTVYHVESNLELHGLCCDFNFINYMIFMRQGQSNMNVIRNVRQRLAIKGLLSPQTRPPPARSWKKTHHTACGPTSATPTKSKHWPIWRQFPPLCSIPLAVIAICFALLGEQRTENLSKSGQPIKDTN